MKKYKILDRKSAVIEKSVKIGNNVIIHRGNILRGDTVIGDNVVLKENNYINDCKIGNDCVIEYSHLDGGEVGIGVKMGPFSRVRRGTKIGNYCKIGNFVEIHLDFLFPALSL